MLNNRKRIIVSISILAIIFIALIGITYAYYAANVTGNTSENPSLNMTSGYLSITYIEGQEFIPSESDGTITAGKAYTKTFTNRKGETTEIAHYYDHQAVGAWISYGFARHSITLAWLISTHMAPFINQKYFNSLDPLYKHWIETLHEADKAAH